VLHEIRRHQALIEHEHVRAGRLNSDVKPVIVVLPKRLDAREVLDTAPLRLPSIRLSIRKLQIS
jgi:hypothetical protein